MSGMTAENRRAILEPPGDVGPRMAQVIVEALILERRMRAILGLERRKDHPYDGVDGGPGGEATG